MGWSVSDTGKYFGDRNPFRKDKGMSGAVQDMGSKYANTLSDLAPQSQGFEPQLMGPASSYHNTDYLSQLRGMASDRGRDAWSWSQNNLAQSQADQAQQSLANQGASSLATNQGNLAMRGGLTSGAAERMGNRNMQQQLMGQQGISRQLSDQRMAISGAADQRQRALLGQLGQAEMGAAKFGAGIDQWNAGQQNQAARNEILAGAIGNQNVSPSQGGLLSTLLNPLGQLTDGLI